MFHDITKMTFETKKIKPHGLYLLLPPGSWLPEHECGLAYQRWNSFSSSTILRELIHKGIILKAASQYHQTTV